MEIRSGIGFLLPFIADDQAMSLADELQPGNSWNDAANADTDPC